MVVDKSISVFIILLHFTVLPAYGIWLWLKISGKATDKIGDRKTNKRSSQEDE